MPDKLRKRETLNATTWMCWSQTKKHKYFSYTETRLSRRISSYSYWSRNNRLEKQTDPEPWRLIAPGDTDRPRPGDVPCLPTTAAKMQPINLLSTQHMFIYLQHSTMNDSESKSWRTCALLARGNQGNPEVFGVAAKQVVAQTAFLLLMVASLAWLIYVIAVSKFADWRRHDHM